MKTLDNFGIALANAEMGIASIPCHYGSKIPMVKWKPFQTELPSPDLLRRWFKGTRVNISIVTSGMVLFDVDDMAKAEMVLTECGDTPHKLKTPHGLHLGYRKRVGTVLQNAVNIKGMEIDIRTDRGLEIIPNSRVEGKEYRWLGEGLKPIADLPVAKIGWTRERPKRKPVPKRPTEIPTDIRRVGGKIHDIFAYILKIPSVQHENGSKGCYRTCCVLRDEGYTPLEAWEILLWWNERTPRPAWPKDQLIHKMESVFRMQLKHLLK